MKRNEKGFGAIEALLLIGIVGIIGGAGWLVYKSQKATNDSLDNSKSSLDSAKAAQEKSKKAPSPAIDPTADWVAYSSKEGQFSFKYPASWATAAHPEACSPGLVLLGGNAASVGTCGSDNIGQIMVLSQDGDVRTNFELSSTHYPDIKTEAVTINAVTGKKQTGSFKNVPGEELGPGQDDGDKTVVYTFYTGNKTYYARYSIKASYPDVLADFNLLITKTFKFSS